MATTTNYGWTTPDDTDLVKDGAAAIRTLGSSVDTTTKALNPETTEGDIAYRSATANTNTRLALGTAGQVLTVNSGEDAPEWATPAGGGGFTTLGTGTLSGSSVTISSIPGTYVNLQLDVFNMTSSVDSAIRIRVNGLTSDYSNSLYYHAAGSSGNQGGAGSDRWSWAPASTAQAASDANHLALTLFNYAATNRVLLAHADIHYLYGDGSTRFSCNGVHTNYAINAAVTSVEIISQAGTFSGGTYVLRGLK
jgi:hypothetical protein